MGFQPVFDSNSGKIILQGLQEEIIRLVELKKKMASNDPIVQRRALEEILAAINEARACIEKMDKDQMQKFKKLRDLFSNPKNFTGQQLLQKQELEKMFEELISIQKLDSKSKAKSSFGSKLKGQKKWKKS